MKSVFPVHVRNDTLKIFKAIISDTFCLPVVRFLADAHVHWPREVELNTVSTALRRLAEGPRWAALFDVMKVSSVLTMSFKADTGGFSSKRDVPALPSLYAIPFGTGKYIFSYCH